MFSRRGKRRVNNVRRACLQQRAAAFCQRCAGRYNVVDDEDALSREALGLLGPVRAGDVCPPLFGASEAAAPIIVHALPVFSICYIFYGFTHTTTSYFYAVDDARCSNALVVAEAVIVCAVVFVMGRLFQVDGIWFAPTVLQIILAIIAGTLLYRRHRARK